MHPRPVDVRHHSVRPTTTRSIYRPLEPREKWWRADRDALTKQNSHIDEWFRIRHVLFKDMSPSETSAFAGTCTHLFHCASDSLYDVIKVSDSSALRFFQTITEQRTTFPVPECAKKDYGSDDIVVRHADRVSHLTYTFSLRGDGIIHFPVFANALLDMASLKRLQLSVVAGEGVTLINSLCRLRVLPRNGVRARTCLPALVDVGVSGDVELCRIFALRRIETVRMGPYKDTDLTEIAFDQIAGAHNSSSSANHLCISLFPSASIPSVVRQIPKTFPKLSTLTVSSENLDIAELLHALWTSEWDMPELKEITCHDFGVHFLQDATPREYARYLARQQTFLWHLQHHRSPDLLKVVCGCINWSRDTFSIWTPQPCDETAAWWKYTTLSRDTSAVTDFEKPKTAVETAQDILGAWGSTYTVAYSKD
ncbi:hypothetical protein PLICRDRAFT_176933 [Plicaturopsis crispa FD-325 SS-3]|nr:hypothetical protein PLICRDRAFT_176933 [Plicaturopsis crispa FD-325 SS-3]